MLTQPATSALLWRAALFTTLIDSPLLILVAWKVSSPLFHKLKWYLAVAAFLIYAVIWGVFGSLLFWDTVYHAIFPDWFRWLLPVVYGLLFGVLALAFWRVSCVIPRCQAVIFCLQGGLISLLGHSIGFARGLMRVPVLEHVSPASALVFGEFEFIFYWCAITCLAACGRWLARRYSFLHKEAMHA